MYVEKEERISYFGGIARRKETTRRPRRKRVIILKRISEKLNGVMRIKSIWLRTGTTGGLL
jgi:hypothetical protein